MMESFTRVGQGNDEMILPAGFRFHPTDEELITHYLAKKAADGNFSAMAVADVDMNKIEPWELPRLAKMGEKEWYFFCVRDKKYPTGLRTNRATDAGYWKATGKDKEIFREDLLVGMKKTLVFYEGRAPKGVKTNWVVHEYRLEGRASLQNLPKSGKNEWALCRVFRKSSGDRRFDSAIGNQLIPPPLPPLMESSAAFGGSRVVNPTMSEPVNVPCFSNPVEIPPTHNNFVGNLNYNFDQNPFIQGQSVQGEYQFAAGFPFPSHGVENLKIESQLEMGTASQDTGVSSSEISSDFELQKRAFGDQEAPSTSEGPIDFDSFWNY